MIKGKIKGSKTTWEICGTHDKAQFRKMLKEAQKQGKIKKISLDQFNQILREDVNNEK